MCARKGKYFSDHKLKLMTLTVDLNLDRVKKNYIAEFTGDKSFYSIVIV